MVTQNYFLILFIKFILITIITHISSVNAQSDCSTAPSATLEKICRKLHQIDKNTRNTPLYEDKLRMPDGSIGAYALCGDLYSCMDLGCLCNFLGGNGTSGTNKCSFQNLKKAIRKEYRMLSDVERARFHAALNAMKRNGDYDMLSKIHSEFAETGGAHSGPAFLPWHREFIKRFEFSLKKVDPRISLPYWDSTLDGVLPTPKDSIMFSNEFMGTTDNAGNLIRGDFAGWRTLTATNILRHVGAEGNCFRERDIQWLMKQNKIDLVLGYPSPRQGCTAPSSFDTLEYTHNAIHTFVGGDMDEMKDSANDPIFFLHHCFVDMIWELWRIKNQNRNERKTVYPLDRLKCSARHHFVNSIMEPFEAIPNINGLCNEYTDNLYEYDPRPSCELGPNCGSK
uniref:Tyrosinase copper-binding domain-containing protein n=1 Tax=Meloidogyne incognita TaxID=6306 RepID=A0A914L6R1_MELIC